MGATMKFGLQQYKNLNMIGLTLSDFQVHHGNTNLSKKAGVIIKENYNQTSFKNNSLDGAIAIESFCHSGHQYDSFQEVYRV